MVLGGERVGLGVRRRVRPAGLLGAASGGLGQRHGHASASGLANGSLGAATAGSAGAAAIASRNGLTCSDSANALSSSAVGSVTVFSTSSRGALSGSEDGSRASRRRAWPRAPETAHRLLIDDFLLRRRRRRRRPWRALARGGHLGRRAVRGGELEPGGQVEGRLRLDLGARGGGTLEEVAGGRGDGRGRRRGREGEEGKGDGGAGHSVVV